jgi:hypothetical protein
MHRSLAQTSSAFGCAQTTYVVRATPLGTVFMLHINTIVMGAGYTRNGIGCTLMFCATQTLPGVSTQSSSSRCASTTRARAGSTMAPGWSEAGTMTRPITGSASAGQTSGAWPCILASTIVHVPT